MGRPGDTYLAPNLGNVVNSFEVHGGNLWAASNYYLCMTNNDVSAWVSELSSPEPLKLLREYNGKLYITTNSEYDSGLYRLDDSEINVIPVAASFEPDNAKKLFVWNDGTGDRLYAVYSHLPMVSRLNVAGDAWDVMVTWVTADFVGSCQDTVIFNNNIYCINNAGVLYALNGLKNAWVQLTPTHDFGGTPFKLAVHDNRLYVCSNGLYLYRLNLAQTDWDYICASPDDYAYPLDMISYSGHLFVMGGYGDHSEFYVFTGSEFLNSWRNGASSSWTGTDTSSSVIFNNKLYYSSTAYGQGYVWRYISISTVFYEADVHSGEDPLPVNFTFVGWSDFPIISYDWDFGDSSAHGTTPNVSHEYIRGTYTPNLTIDNGLDSDSTSGLGYYFRSLIDVYDTSVTYEITNATELQKIGSPGNKPLNIKGCALRGNYKVMNDFDASETATWNGGLGFDPCSKESQFNVFSGTLDGNNHTISNLYINRPAENYYAAGILSWVTVGSTIKDLTMENASVVGTGDVGVIVGWFYDTGGDRSTISNCNIVGGAITTYSNNRGGIAGSAYKVDFINCHSSIGFTSYNSSDTGGLVGYASECSYDNCSYENDTIQDLTGTGYIGGIVGYHYSYNDGLGRSISNCTVTANFLCDENAGLIAGTCYYGNAINCNVYGSIKGVRYNSGTFIGYCYSSSVDDCNSYATIELRQDSSVSYIGGFIGYFYGNYDPPNHCKNSSVSIDVKAGPGQSTYSVGGFTGYGGNIRYENCHVIGNNRGGDYIGGFIGYSNSDSFINCSAQCNIEATRYANSVGVFGGYGYMSADTTISDCHVSGTITVIGDGNGNGNYVGGFFGYIYGNIIQDSYADVDIIITDAVYIYSVGGFSGYYSGITIKNCYATGTVQVYGSDGQNVGGFSGYAYVNTEMSECYTTGNVESNVNNIGGFSGSLSVNNPGGICKICYSTGNVEGYSNIGGFVGNLSYGEIADCYAHGDVNSLEFEGSGIGTGGFIGWMPGGSNSPVNRVYSIGKVTALIGGVGGLIGNCNSVPIVNDSYWDLETSEVATSAGGTGRDTTTMKTRDNFVDWDFINIWDMIDGETYPLFEVPEPPPVPIVIQFVGNPLQGPVPLTVHFTDLSTW